MEVGSDEWKERVSNNYMFPNVFAAYITTDKKIVNIVVNTKADNVGNITYTKVNTRNINNSMEAGVKAALVEVRRIRNVNQYAAWVTELRNDWGITK